MSSPFRIAFLGVDHPHGAGWREVLPLLGDAVELVAVVPGLDGTIASLEERHAHVPRFATAASLIEWGQFDGAFVCLPNADTPAAVVALARAGKHVLIEKPGAASEAEWVPAASALVESGVSFQAGYLWRYDPGAERLRTMISEGRFGRLISIEAGLFTSDVRRRGPAHYLFDPTRSGRGFFNWLGCHVLDLIPFLTGSRVVAVTARVGSFGATATSVEDGGTVVLELEAGTLVTITGGYWVPRWLTELGWTFRGSERWVQWEPTRKGTGGTFHIHGPQPQFHAMEETFSLPEDRTPGYGGARSVRLIRDWVERAPTRNTVDSVGQTLRLLDLIYRSSREGRRLELDSPSQGPGLVAGAGELPG
jgi:predicted dehydrogenase